MRLDQLTKTSTAGCEPWCTDIGSACEHGYDLGLCPYKGCAHGVEGTELIFTFSVTPPVPPPPPSEPRRTRGGRRVAPKPQPKPVERSFEVVYQREPYVLSEEKGMIDIGHRWLRVK